VPVNDSVGSLNALGIAYEALQRGTADILITGGTEAFLHSLVFLEQSHQSETWVLGTDPQAYRPFDRRAAGLIPAEGAGICILEDYEHAQRRGAPIYGEIIGFGQTNDAHGLRSPSNDGRQYARAISLAMQEGQLRSEEISYFSLDGRALPTSDRGEAEALHLAFGSGLEHLPVSIPRTMLGHSYAAAGALDTITSLLALRDGLIPPTINCEELNPSYGLNVIHDKARSSSINRVLIGGRSTGGTNIVLAIKS
jgi:3-oxoacyl-(acyl-carrier-protein) synthase